MEPNSQQPPVDNATLPGTDNGHKKVGPIVATLVIILILIIAALYLFASRVNQQPIPTDTASVAVDSSSTDTQTVAPINNSADDPQSLQNDLNSATNGVSSQNF